jgi:S-adenosyl methyltransferase
VHLYREGGMVTSHELVKPAGIDATVASPARVYDYWLGGKDNFAVDRAAGEAMREAFPGIVMGVQMNRAFLGRAVTYLAAEAGVRQFLDIGTGLPTADNTHEVAQRAAPSSRVVYVDNDPMVLRHAQAMMPSHPEGACDYVQADLREPEAILKAAARTLDYRRPVAVSLLMILQFIPDVSDPWRLVAQVMGSMPSGSYLAISHPTRDVIASTITEAASRYNAHMGDNQALPRARAEILRFFAGLDLVDPGLVQLQRWRPEPGAADGGHEMPALAGIARKP